RRTRWWLLPGRLLRAVAVERCRSAQKPEAREFQMHRHPARDRLGPPRIPLKPPQRVRREVMPSFVECRVVARDAMLRVGALLDDPLRRERHLLAPRVIVQ